MGLLDFIFPKYCVGCRKVGEYICYDCFAFISFDFDMICLVCNKPSFDGMTHPGCRNKYAIDGTFCAVSYKGIVKKLIYNFKYKPYLADLNKSLVALFYESVIQQELFIKTIEKLDKEKFIMVPVPLSAKKLNKRGYNHAEMLAKGLSKKLNIPVLNILERVKETKVQYGLKLKDRKENVKGAFVVSPKYPSTSLRTSSIFLVDDILTSGSTLLEAARMLKKNGTKKVWGLTLARD